MGRAQGWVTWLFQSGKRYARRQAKKIKTLKRMLTSTADRIAVLNEWRIRHAKMSAYRKRQELLIAAQRGVFLIKYKQHSTWFDKILNQLRDEKPVADSDSMLMRTPA